MRTTWLLVALAAGLVNPISAIPWERRLTETSETLQRCPSLKSKEQPRDARDVRPDQISVMMALGDSITAGLFARPASEDTVARSDSRWRPNAAQQVFPGFKGFEEFRGISFSTGGDKEAVSIANSVKHYNPDLKGQSFGHHRPGIFSLSEPSILDHSPANDGLNAARSGAKAKDLVGQVTSYLLPGMEELGVKADEWKLMTLSIGANDVCDYCLAGNSTLGGPGSPEAFAENVKQALLAAKDNIPNLVVDLVGLFQVSAIYNLSMQSPQCTPLKLPPIFPTLPIECQCAWAPGPLGDASRKKMDALGEDYNQALQVVVRELNEHAGDDFLIVWQPGTFLALADFPTIALSPIDCFHPSREAHKRIGAGLWNRLVVPREEKAIPMKWDESDHLRCLRDDDRIQLGTCILVPAIRPDLSPEVPLTKGAIKRAAALKADHARARARAWYINKDKYDDVFPWRARALSPLSPRRGLDVWDSTVLQPGSLRPDKGTYASPFVVSSSTTGIDKDFNRLIMKSLEPNPVKGYQMSELEAFQTACDELASMEPCPSQPI